MESSKTYPFQSKQWWRLHHVEQLPSYTSPIHNNHLEIKRSALVGRQSWSRLLCLCIRVRLDLPSCAFGNLTGWRNKVGRREIESVKTKVLVRYLELIRLWGSKLSEEPRSKYKVAQGSWFPNQRFLESLRYWYLSFNDENLDSWQSLDMAFIFQISKSLNRIESRFYRRLGHVIN